VRGPGGFVRAKLHRRLFVAFGMSILVTVLVVGGLVSTVSNDAWKRDVARLTLFASGRFAHVWDSPADRDELARAVARDLDVDIRLVDDGGAELFTSGALTCGGHELKLPVTRDGAHLGTIEACVDRHHMYGMGPRVLLSVVLAGFILWVGSGVFARRIGRPLAEVARVATEIGGGNLQSRVQIGRRLRRFGEVAVVGDAMNRMAEKIEKQFRDQRELLAAVSHEIRTPLARIRLLLELARERGVDDPGTAEIEREIVEMDALVAELLASSRVDFSALSRTEIDGADAGRRALERANVATSKLVVEGETTLHADPTLLARALANLIENARAHGGGLAALRISARDDRIAFEAEDAGPGIPPGEEERVFAPFVRGAASSSDRPSLGLGLALVRRIADAHGGRAYATARNGGGAVVGIELPIG
jgi:two-component system, OmpR family, sensor kinase